MTATTERQPRKGRGRRPADEVRADVLKTVGDILLTDGLARFTIDRVAQESGVSKTTIYKWWPSKGALALDGYFHAVETTLAFPDTGDLRADLETQLHSFVRNLTKTPAGPLLRELIGAAQTDADLAVAYQTLYSSGRRQLAVERMQHGQAVGQLRADIDARVLVDQLWGAVYHRLLIPDEPINDALVVALVSNLFDGVAPAHDPHEEPGEDASRVGA